MRIRTIILLSGLVILAACDHTEKSESRKKADEWIKKYTEAGPSTPEGRKKAEEWVKRVLEEEKK
jgi:hypothetical protein